MACKRDVNWNVTIILAQHFLPESRDIWRYELSPDHRGWREDRTEGSPLDEDQWGSPWTWAPRGDKRVGCRPGPGMSTEGRWSPPEPEHRHRLLHTHRKCLSNSVILERWKDDMIASLHLTLDTKLHLYCFFPGKQSTMRHCLYTPAPRQKHCDLYHASEMDCDNSQSK